MIKIALTEEKKDLSYSWSFFWHIYWQAAIEPVFCSEIWWLLIVIAYRNGLVWKPSFWSSFFALTSSITCLLFWPKLYYLWVALKPLVHILYADSEAIAKIFRKSKARSSNMHFMNRWYNAEDLNTMLYSLARQRKGYLTSIYNSSNYKLLNLLNRSSTLVF